MCFNAFLTGSVEVCFGGKGKRFMVLDSKIMRRKKTQFIYYRHLKKCNSLFCLGGTSLFCLFVRSTVSSVENAGAQMTFQNCLVRRGMTCQSTTLASHWPGASLGKGKGGQRGSSPLLWAIRRQFWKLREGRASFLKAQVCHTTSQGCCGHRMRCCMWSRQHLSCTLQTLIKWQPLYNYLTFVECLPMSKEGT